MEISGLQEYVAKGQATAQGLEVRLGYHYKSAHLNDIFSY